MPVIKLEDIRGYAFSTEVFCCECAPDDQGELKANNVLTEEDVETDEFFFCDRCGKLL